MNVAVRVPAIAIGLMTGFAVHAIDNEPSGFRGIEWGSSLQMNSAELSEMEKSETEKFYFRKGEKLVIGGAQLESITYVYWKDAFFGVMILTKGVSNKSALIDAFKAQFGQPRRPNPYLDEYSWLGPLATILINCNSVTDTCRATLMSTELFTRQREEKKQAAQAAKKDF